MFHICYYYTRDAMNAQAATLFVKHAIQIPTVINYWPQSVGSNQASIVLLNQQ